MCVCVCCLRRFCGKVSGKLQMRHVSFCSRCMTKGTNGAHTHTQRQTHTHTRVQMTRVLTTTNMLKMLCQKPKATSNNKNSSKQEKRCLFSVCTSHRAETTSPSPSLNLAPFVTICENVRKYFKNVFSTSMAALHFGTRRTCRCSCRVAPARPRERETC